MAYDAQTGHGLLWVKQCFPKLTAKKIWKKGRPKFTIMAEQVAGDAPNKYNCLGWVLGQVRDYNGNQDFNEANLNATMAAHGYVPCDDAAQADIDVWYHPTEVGISAEHVSKRESDGMWSSKLGDTGPLIKHKRDGLNGDDYGTVRAHYRRRA
ncbi:hypothetical protein V8F06_013860 [Rhypophila decipiens]